MSKLTKQDKKALVINLKKELEEAKSVAVVDYQGLGMQDIETLRNQIREAGGSFLVIKNTLLKRALGMEGTEEIEKGLVGPTAVILAKKDELAPLSKVGKMAKEKQLPKFKFGIFNKQVVESEKLSVLANLPGKEVLWAQAVSAVAGPIYGLVYSLQANMQNLIYILGEYKSRRVEIS